MAVAGAYNKRIEIIKKIVAELESRESITNRLEPKIDKLEEFFIELAKISNDSAALYSNLGISTRDISSEDEDMFTVVPPKAEPILGLLGNGKRLAFNLINVMIPFLYVGGTEEQIKKTLESFLKA